VNKSGVNATEPVQWERSERVLWRRMPDRILVAAADEDEVLVLTAAGTVLWDLLTEPTDVQAAVDFLAELYRTDPRVVMADILPLIDQLARHRAIQAIDPGQPR
jgi:hypothetical protein